jgi:hypothetical protein
MTTSLKKLVSSLALAAVALVGSQSTLLAIPISGLVEMQGTIQLNNTVLGAASGTVDTGNNEATVVGTSTGAYETTAGAVVDWKAFSWNPITPLPITSLWSFTSGGRTYSFDLSALSVVTHDANFLDIAGNGTLKISDVVSGTNYEDTFGLWSFQVTSASGSSGTAKFIFQSSNATPDGGTTALLIGVGLVAMSVVAHRRRLTKA